MPRFNLSVECQLAKVYTSRTFRFLSGCASRKLGFLLDFARRKFLVHIFTNMNYFQSHRNSSKSPQKYIIISKYSTFEILQILFISFSTEVHAGKFHITSPKLSREWSHQKVTKLIVSLQNVFKISQLNRFQIWTCLYAERQSESSRSMVLLLHMCQPMAIRLPHNSKLGQVVTLAWIAYGFNAKIILESTSFPTPRDIWWNWFAFHWSVCLNKGGQQDQ